VASAICTSHLPVTPRASFATIENQEEQHILPIKNLEKVQKRFWLVKEQGEDIWEQNVVIEDGQCQHQLSPKRKEDLFIWSGLLKIVKGLLGHKGVFKMLKVELHLSLVSPVHWYYFQANLIWWEGPFQKTIL
jgi:hypothetical protein